MAQVSGDEEIGPGRFSAFEETVVIVVNRGDDSINRLHNDRVSLQSRQQLARPRVNSRQFCPRKHIPVFSQNRGRNTRHYLASGSHSGHPGLQALRLPARRNQNIRIENNPHCNDPGTPILTRKIDGEN